jgi:hypothetical protein
MKQSRMRLRSRSKQPKQHDMKFGGRNASRLNYIDLYSASRVTDDLALQRLISRKVCFLIQLEQ